MARGARSRGGVLDLAALEVPVARAARGTELTMPPADGGSSAREERSPERIVAEMQRSRLLGAAVRVLEQQGYEHATVAHITGRARVSRRTFYELFENREQCIATVLSDAAAQVEEELRRAQLTGRPWRERIRGGLWAMLCFLEREPELARVLVVHALRGSGPVNEAREEIIARLVAAVDEGRAESARAKRCSELTAEGVVGATLAILYGRLARGSRESLPLTELLGELTATVLLPYLGSAAARREQARPAPVDVEAPTGTSRAATHDDDPLQGLSMRLTYRTARVLEGVARRPGASNRQLGDFAGIHDQGQVSKLLARLESLGLLCKQSSGRAKGEPNRWTLTRRGALVAQSIASPGGGGGVERQVA